MTEYDTAARLEEVLQQTSLREDELLAFLAYAVHGDTRPLTEARSEGAEVGNVGSGARMLKDRIKKALS